MLKNKTKNKIISEEEKVLTKESEIEKGLRFKKLGPNKALYFKLPKTKKWVVDMLFVFQKLDLIYLKDHKVVELKQAIKPFMLYFPKKKANALIECPAGTIKKTKTSIGDNTQYLKKSRKK